MSKLAVLRQYRYSPAAGGLFGTIGKVLGGAVNILTGTSIFKSKAAAVAPAAAAPQMTAAAKQLIKNGGGGGGTRRGKGISKTELRGYRKVANLLHKEGMVSKKARGRKS